jgi:hypothetical protein
VPQGALFEACHAKEREGEFALPKQKTLRLHFAACRAGEPGGEDLYALNGLNRHESYMSRPKYAKASVFIFR